MLKEDIIKVMSVEEYGAFLQWVKKQSVQYIKTDHEHVRTDYYEYDVHRFLDYIRGTVPEEKVPDDKNAG